MDIYNSRLLDLAELFEKANDLIEEAKKANGKDLISYSEYQEIRDSLNDFKDLIYDRSNEIAIARNEAKRKLSASSLH